MGIGPSYFPITFKKASYSIEATQIWVVITTICNTINITPKTYASVILLYRKATPIPTFINPPITHAILLGNGFSGNFSALNRCRIT